MYVMSFHLSSQSLSSFPARHQRQISAGQAKPQAQRKRTSQVPSFANLPNLTFFLLYVNS